MYPPLNAGVGGKDGPAGVIGLVIVSGPDPNGGVTRVVGVVATCARELEGTAKLAVDDVGFGTEEVAEAEAPCRRWMGWGTGGRVLR